MFGWVVRLVLIAGGAVTSLFTTVDAPNFGIIQSMATIILITLLSRFLRTGYIMRSGGAASSISASFSLPSI
jgi:hypothetical protein